MPTRKISNLPVEKICQHREHLPPIMRVFTPGIYEHECPDCGNVIRFVVPEAPSYYDDTRRESEYSEHNDWVRKQDESRPSDWRGS